MHRFLILTVLFVGGCGKSIENTAETSSRSNAESQHLVDTVAATPESVVGAYEGIGEFVANSTWVLKPNGAANMLFEGELLLRRRWSISDTGEVVVDGDRYKLTSNGDLVCDDMALGIIEYKRVKDTESTSETKTPPGVSTEPSE